ncbi:MAG: MBL fold metallo-hydrolase [Candidatus Omnitrophota bacterium]
MIENLHWLGHSSFRWQGSKTVYFDPWKLSKNAVKSDIICVSHEHYDHFSKPDITAISMPETVIVTCENVERDIDPREIGCKEARVMAPGESIDIYGVKIEAVASYNTDKLFHTKRSKKLGFIVTMDGVSVYHAGDTDRIPEMSGVRCDIALLPIGGTYTMTAGEAAEAALSIRPKVAVPMHYGTVPGAISDTDRFERDLKGKVEVKILRKEE